MYVMAERVLKLTVNYGEKDEKNEFMLDFNVSQIMEYLLGPNWNKIEDLPGEIWKNVFKYEGLYLVSNKARVKNIKNPNNHKLLKPTKWGSTRIVPGKEKYLSVALSKNGKTTKVSLHKVVLEAFKGENPSGMQCLHEDEANYGFNNQVEFIRWGTPEENILTRTKGKRDKRLPKERILYIKNSKKSNKELSIENNLTLTVIQRIRDGITYKKVLEDA